jgi:hypothetical protein
VVPYPGVIAMAELDATNALRLDGEGGADLAGYPVVIGD